MYIEIIIALIASLGGGGVAACITAWAMNKKIKAEAEETEARIRDSVLQGFQTRIEFLNTQVAVLQKQVLELQEENELLRKRLEVYRKEYVGCSS